jgi:hypothetical protein
LASSISFILSVPPERIVRGDGTGDAICACPHRSEGLQSSFALICKATTSHNTTPLYFLALIDAMELVGKILKRTLHGYHFGVVTHNAAKVISKLCGDALINLNVE